MYSLNSIQAMKFLQGFVSPAQLLELTDAIQGEEGAFFSQLVIDLAERIQIMPKTYETDGQGDEAVAYLHYYLGGADWYITERDSEPENLQAFGLVNMMEIELGYINIEELIANGVEMDLYWTPKTLKAIR